VPRSRSSRDEGQYSRSKKCEKTREIVESVRNETVKCKESNENRNNENLMFSRTSFRQFLLITSTLLFADRS